MKKYLLFLVAIIFFQNKIFATHAAGMDIRYECLGGNEYRITVSFYRDCAGIDAPLTLDITLTNTCTSQTATFTAPLIFSTLGSDSISHLAGLCPSQSSVCTGGIAPGYEQYIYQTTVTLPSECSDWLVSTAVSSRNSAITNLQSADSYDLYEECHINNMNGLCDNSPYFTNVPLSYCCIDQIWNYNHGAIDPDGDSLVYQLVNPLGGFLQPIPYANGSGFSPTYPLATQSGTFGFDPLTGQMVCVPSQQAFAVISVLITEYRDDSIVGSTQRDLQVIIQTCSNIVPEIPFGITNVVSGTQLDSTTVQICPGQFVQFDLVGIDSNLAQSLTIATNLSNTIPDATFNTTGSNPITGTFAWQTQIGDSGYYVFSLTITDDACPISGQQVYSYTVLVSPTSADAGPDTMICETDPVIQLHVIADPPFAWDSSPYLNDTSLQNPTATLPGQGQYMFIVTANVGGFCEDKDTVIVTVTPAVTGNAQAVPDSVCAGSPVNLASNGGGGIGTYSYQWTSIPSGFNSNQSSATVYPNTSTEYIVNVQSGGCHFLDTVPVLVHPLPDPSFVVGPTGVCAGTLVDVTYTGGSGSGLTFDWDFGGGTPVSGSGAGPYQVTWPDNGTQTVSLLVTDAIGCADTLTQNVTIFPTPTADFSSNTIGCEPLVINFTDSSTLADTYQWDFGDGNASTQQDPSHTYSPGVYDVTLVVTNTTSGCTDTLALSNYITSLAIPIANASVLEPYDQPVDLSQATFHFINLSQNANTYQWDFGDQTLSNETDPTHTFTSLDTFYVVLVASNGYCDDTAKLGPFIIVSYHEIYFPNAFSPNGDGLNDFFHELGFDGIVALDFSIYNRWGQVIFETNDITGSWDGTYNGEPADVGVYVWVAHASMINGDHLDRKGNLTLVR